MGSFMHSVYFPLFIHHVSCLTLFFFILTLFHISLLSYNPHHSFCFSDFSSTSTYSSFLLSIQTFIIFTSSSSYLTSDTFFFSLAYSFSFLYLLSCFLLSFIVVFSSCLNFFFFSLFLFLFLCLPFLAISLSTLLLCTFIPHISCHSCYILPFLFLFFFISPFLFSSYRLFLAPPLSFFPFISFILPPSLPSGQNLRRHLASSCCSEGISPDGHSLPANIYLYPVLFLSTTFLGIRFGLVPPLPSISRFRFPFFTATKKMGRWFFTFVSCCCFFISGECCVVVVYLYCFIGMFCV